MLPTPDTAHVAYERIYEPAEDSFLLLDTLSLPAETSFLTDRFRDYAPFIVEIGTGSGVVVAFANAHSNIIFGTRNALIAGIDLNQHACEATLQTVKRAASEPEQTQTHGNWLGALRGDLAGPLRDGSVDVLIFNPPYVPTPEMPQRPGPDLQTTSVSAKTKGKPNFEEDSYLLSLSYAGGKDGMETTNRLIDSVPRLLSPIGCAYILLCAQNKPEEVKSRIRDFGTDWEADTVGSSGKTAGWEKLQIVRVWRDQ